ncbi:MAG: tRNA (N(6)-L-threonylcarbamoyladenosine(37)-C(2))-methylthiotransferase MtaB [Alistipes sp.]|jgi:threonylcarbamoyladenosine tRNA methylthiotransferase MtaB|nr:tRNA (N(6)-L-threonylcarbamoyladenosine(37)-C(2))-methylthiotransferase MtaB [Alistipes sp.]MBQ5924193.1 tRNA (N(6)-L-threonylcarbamoyladenosine(37)-C(2))-methylthiotransferase MtaB [Alistipes sp.]MEE1147836.1 tRNA (N(6)-L-threonylcarbamoyladenosine(37)-C(2))-methylthiotransferase MtaB [Alistipes sp.]
MGQKRVSFHTLGCKLNFSESSTLAREFERGGYLRVEPSEATDVAVINSCSVTEHADKKCRNIIRKIHRRNPNAIIAVTGCYAQLKPEDIAKIEGVNIVLGNNDKGDLYRRVEELRETTNTEVYSCSVEEMTRFFAAYSSGDRTRSFLKVQDGCDYKCAYCTIHYARGHSRNIPIADIVAEAREIVAAGQKEIVITGINTGDFGRTTGEKFIDLLRALDEVEGVERYRISSIEPNLITDEIIELCAKSSKFVPHFHIPLQSGSTHILGLMRRRYTADRYRERIAKIREMMPDAFLGVDVIVGFPGEGEEEFMETYRLLEEVGASFLHIFPFSERPGTPAVDMPNKVQPRISTERVQRLEALSDRLHKAFAERYLGSEREVLFESTDRNGLMYGYTDNYLRVSAPYDTALINNICRVRLVAFDEEGNIRSEIVG